MVGVGAPLCREKKKEKTAKQSFQPSWTEFLQGPYLQTGMRTPVFLLSLRSPHQIVPKNAKKKFRIFWTPPPKNFFSGHAIIKITQTQEFSVFISEMMLNGPKNGLTYTQNDREKWRNTFRMIVSASLHVLVTEKVQQASTITLAPRCSHASDSPGPAMVEFLSNPFIPCNFAPQISQYWWRLPPYTTCSMRPEGGPLGQAAKPRPKGCGPLPLPSGQATLQFWAVGGAMLSLTPKNHI